MFSEYRVYSSYDKVLFGKIEIDNTKKTDDLILLNKEGKTKFNKYIINTGILNYQDFKKIKNRNNTYYFDNKELLNQEIIVRTRKPGDKFKPFGMGGSKKIKKYFIDEKIPKDLREEIPLIVDENNNILVILGHKRSDYYKISKDSKKIFYISYEVQKNGK